MFTFKTETPKRPSLKNRRAFKGNRLDLNPTRRNLSQEFEKASQEISAAEHFYETQL